MGVFFKYTPGLYPIRIRPEKKQIRDALYHSLDIDGNVEGLHANTLRAMRKNGLLDEENKITPRAFYGIIEEMSLQKQCKIIFKPCFRQIYNIIDSKSFKAIHIFFPNIN